MFWLIIILIMAALIGPVVYLMPTKRERRQSKARLLARKVGMRVSVETLPDFSVEREEFVSPSGIVRSPTVESTVYRLRLDKPDERASTWIIYKSKNVVVGYVPSPLTGGVWEGLGEDTLPIMDNYWERLEKAMMELPEKCLALEVTNEFVAWKGKEAFGNQSPDLYVERMKKTLSDIAKNQDI